jgi:AraC family transcriptional regulator
VVFLSGPWQTLDYTGATDDKFDQIAAPRTAQSANCLIESPDMNPIDGALWYIETRFASELTLEQIAGQVRVSPHYLTRAFGAVTGRSLMRYVRARRLTHAARLLAEGAPDILGVAIESGYGSHEAFTRAFRDQFGLTPEAVRGQRHVDNLALVEPLTMDQNTLKPLEPPRFETHKAMLIAGIGERYSCENSAGIPSQWQRFQPHLGHVPGQVDKVAYGVVCNQDDAGDFDYIAGVEVRDFSEAPADFARVRVPQQRYAVFKHREHISGIRNTMTAIWTKWLPESGHEVADAPVLERYGEEFDGRTGHGGLEVWVPIK